MEKGGSGQIPGHEMAAGESSDTDSSTETLVPTGDAGDLAELQETVWLEHAASPAPEASQNDCQWQDYAGQTALIPGYQLQEYAIKAVLGSGGFGITYLAHDSNLQYQVAIKEYLPSGVATRISGQTVCPITHHEEGEYRQGLARFLGEARVLANFRHHNIVRVTRFFEANNTAYMVMEYEKGESLRQWSKNHTPLEEETLLKMLLPLLDGLETVHQAGVLHRDIKPANIYVRDADGSLVLLDFGAARYASGSTSHSLTSMVTPGYAPFEQYHTRGAQGPWSDIYALGGVLYWMVTGQRPHEAPARIKVDSMPSAESLAGDRYSRRLLRAIDWALKPDENLRPRDIAEFRAALTGDSAQPEENAQSQAIGLTTALLAKVLKPDWAGRLPQLIAGMAVLAAMAAGGYLLMNQPRENVAVSTSTTIPTTSSSTTMVLSATTSTQLPSQQMAAQQAE